MQDDFAFRRIRPERNENRFYAACVTTDLFGNILVRRNWGRIGTGGRLRHDRVGTLLEARRLLQRLAARKLARGYRGAG